MSLNKKILPIVLQYEEQGQTRTTLDCLKVAGFTKWLMADREGVGSMSRAFNRAVRENQETVKRYEFIWFVTNVSFAPSLPASLLEALESHPGAIAVHPAMDSDHPHIRQNGQEVKAVPFIEWTAPLIAVEGWEDVGELDEAMPYVHFDLDWSHRARQAGWELLVDGRVKVNHTYLWKKAPEKISHLRRELRALRHPASVARMVEKWGPDWKKKLCPTNTCG